jgi:hypothetical protein
MNRTGTDGRHSATPVGSEYTQSRSPRNLLLRGTAVAVGVGIVCLAMATIPMRPSAAATAVPSISVSPRATNLVATTSVDLLIGLSGSRPASSRWSVEGTPAGVASSVRCPSSRSCVLTLRADADVLRTTSLVEVVLRSGQASRRVPFALHVDPIAFLTPPGTPTPTVPVTTPPPATTTTSATTTTTPRTFILRPSTLIATSRPGARVSFNIDVLRNGWTGPVDMVVDTMPQGWQAAFLPNPTSNSSTLLILDSPAGALPGDYQIRISGHVGTNAADAVLVVRLRTPELALAVVSAPSVSPGGTTRFLLDARSVDDAALPVFVRAEGLPAGSSVFVTPNPALGAVAVDISVPAAIAQGSYVFTFVANRDGVELRIGATLVVSGTNTGAFRFVPTPAIVVPGEGFGYGLLAATNTVSLLRGGTVSLDVQVIPHGGFIDPIDFSLTTPVGWGVSWVGIGTNMFKLTIVAPTTAPLGATALVLNSSSGTLAASVNFTANVL